jgi:hypothetical protein
MLRLAITTGAFIAHIILVSCQSPESTVVEKLLNDLRKENLDIRSVIDQNIAFQSDAKKTQYLPLIEEQLTMVRQTLKNGCEPKMVKHGDDATPAINLKIPEGQVVFYIVCGENSLPILLKDGKISSITTITKGSKPKYLIEY